MPAEEAKTFLSKNLLRRQGTKVMPAPDKKLDAMFDKADQKRQSKTLSNDMEFTQNMFSI